LSKEILKADFAFRYTIRDVNLLYWNKRITTMKKGKKMERYKVILVDDEAEVIDMIEKKIHWNDLGFEVAGSATNGVKALELVEKLQPDVVLTDIKMPYMDGLELSRRLNREYPNIYIMLCTGFDEFEYAKEAVHLEIKEYMLKPVNATELSESLTNLKHTLDREREEKLNVKKLNDYFQEVLPKLQSNFFISLIEGRVEKHDYERFLQAYQVDMKGPLFGCVIFHTSENHVPEGMNPLLLSMSVEREIKQRLMDQWNCLEFIYMGNTLLILELDAEDQITQITDACDRFCRWAYRIMGAVVTAGIGTVCDSLYEISLSYERAREAVSYRVLYGTKRAINIGEIVPKEQIKPVQSEESRMQTLFRAIRIGDSTEIERAAHGEMEKLHKNTETMSQYNLATMEIVSGFFKFCTDNSLDFNKISGNMQNIYEKVSQMDESSLTAWIVQMSETISEKLKCARNSSARRLIVEAQNIVKERYMEADISLDEICAVLGVSNSYFSSLFKKEAGKSFISYLTDYRMDIAAEMILNTDEKSYTIAEKVGYLDANYFSYVFKKKFGVSPSKYRASVK
jgi:YesN/AraC family two-component response regulator